MAASQTSRRRYLFWLFVLPALLPYLVFFLIPLGASFALSFTEWNGLRADVNFIGLYNYATIFTADPAFLTSLLITLVFSALYVVVSNVLAFAFALLLDSGLKGHKVYKSIVFMPNAISLIIVAFVFNFMFAKVYGGIVEAFNLPDFFDISWFRNGDSAMAAMIIAYMWHGTGFYMVIYIAGLQMIHKEHLEAAEIDGASSLQKLFRVIIPLTMPSITINLFLSLTNAFKAFEMPFQMTSGGPGKATEVLALNIYREAFVRSRMGLGSAKAVLMFLLVLAVTVVQLKITKSREVEA